MTFRSFAESHLALLAMRQPPANLRSATARLRSAGRWSVELLRRLYPVAIVFAIFATLLFATILLRLAIWLPAFRH